MAISIVNLDDHENISVLKESKEHVMVLKYKEDRSANYNSSFKE